MRFKCGVNTDFDLFCQEIPSYNLQIWEIYGVLQMICLSCCRYVVFSVCCFWWWCSSSDCVIGSKVILAGRQSRPELFEEILFSQRTSDVSVCALCMHLRHCREASIVNCWLRTCFFSGHDLPVDLLLLVVDLSRTCIIIYLYRHLPVLVYTFTVNDGFSVWLCKLDYKTTLDYCWNIQRKWCGIRFYDIGRNFSVVQNTAY